MPNHAEPRTAMWESDIIAWRGCHNPHQILKRPFGASGIRVGKGSLGDAMGVNIKATETRVVQPSPGRITLLDPLHLPCPIPFLYQMILVLPDPRNGIRGDTPYRAPGGWSQGWKKCPVALRLAHASACVGFQLLVESQYAHLQLPLLQPLRQIDDGDVRQRVAGG